MCRFTPLAEKSHNVRFVFGNSSGKYKNKTKKNIITHLHIRKMERNEINKSFRRRKGSNRVRKINYINKINILRSEISLAIHMKNENKH